MYILMDLGKAWITLGTKKSKALVYRKNWNTISQVSKRDTVSVHDLLIACENDLAQHTKKKRNSMELASRGFCIILPFQDRCV